MGEATIHRYVLVMGVCGVGKSSVGRALSEALHATFIEGDDYHPADNKARMAAGQPLTDDMRFPWLDAIAAAARQSDPSRPVVIACSALKQSYRSRLTSSLPGLSIVHLTGDRDLISARMAARRDHFMPQTLLASQLADLEPPRPEEALVLSIDRPVEELISDIRRVVEPLAVNYAPSPGHPAI